MATTVFDLQAILGIDTSGFENGLKNAAKLGAAALGAASAALVKFGSDSVQVGAEFDKSMSQVAATMGKTMDEMENAVGSTTYTLNGEVKEFSGTLRDFAQEMGRNTAFSATQAADALNYMALAGYDVKTSMDMLPNVLNLAAAGDMDLARASDMVTDSATAMGLTLEDGSVDMERVTLMVDEMAKAASTGNTSVEQLGDAFLTVGGLAQELNGGFVTLDDGTEVAVDGLQELEIALTAMANAGIKGNEAGTHMRNMLLKLSSPTSDGAKQLEKLGVKVFDTEGNMRSLRDVMGDLSGALGELTQEQKIQAISDLFNTRDLASAEALLNAVGQDWDSIGASILDAEGAASQMAATQLDNLAGDVILFKSALEGAQIAVSDVLTPSLREFVKFGTEGLSRLTEAFQEGGITGAMDVFGDILAEGLSMIISKVPDLIDAAMKLLMALGQGLLDNKDIIFNAIAEVVNMVVEYLPLLSVNITQAIIDLVTGWWNTVAQIVPNLIPAVIDSILSALLIITNQDNINKLVEAGIALCEGFLNGFLDAVGDIAVTLPGIIQRLVQAIPDVVTKIADALKKNVPILIQGVVSLVQSIAEALPTIIQSIVEILPDLIDTLVDTLIELLPVLINGIVQIITALAEALPEIITVLVEALPDIITSIIEGIITLVPMIVGGIITLIAAILTHLPEIIAALIMAIPEIITAILTGLAALVAPAVKLFADLFSNIGQALKNWWTEKKESISNGWSDFITSAKEWFAQLPYNLGYALADLWLKVVEMERKIWDWITTKLPEIILGIVEWFEGLPGRIWEWLVNVVTNIVQWGADMIDTVKEEVPKIIDNIETFFKELPGKALQWGIDMIQGFIDGIGQMAQNAWNAVSDFAQGIADRIGFSVPKLGPLSDADKYAPDMIELFTQGIKNNEDLLYDTIEDAFDFQNLMTANAPAPALAMADGSVNMDSGMIDMFTEALRNVIIEVNIGDNKLDDIISTSIQRTNYRSGGR